MLFFSNVVFFKFCCYLNSGLSNIFFKCYFQMLFSNVFFSCIFHSFFEFFFQKLFQCFFQMFFSVFFQLIITYPIHLFSWQLQKCKILVEPWGGEGGGGQRNCSGGGGGGRGGECHRVSKQCNTSGRYPSRKLFSIVRFEQASCSLSISHRTISPYSFNTFFQVAHAHSRV